MKTVLALLLLTGLAQMAEAKDLTQRLGVGIKNPSSQVSELAVHYYPTSEYTWVGGLSMDTLKSQSHSRLSAGLRRHLMFEPNLNFFVGGRVSLVNQETANVNESGFALAALSGVEFFLPGLENLAFQAEFGVEMSSLGSSRLSTVGGSLGQMGVVFYF